MRWLLSLVGVLLALVGAFWFLQGVNVIPVGFMAGQPQYAILGFIVALLGVGLIVFANRRARGAAAARSPADRTRRTP